MTEDNAQSRREYIVEQKKKYGRHIFGVFPIYYPKEILWAMNILPVEIWDPPLNVSNANMHLQPYICSVVRLGLELILQGKCGDLDGFLFPHTCDSIQNMASIVNDYLGLDKPCYFFYHPKAPYSGPSRKFYEDQVKELADRIGLQLGPLDLKELGGYREKGEKISLLLKELYEKRAEGSLMASNVRFYQAVRRGEFLHPDDFIPYLERFISASRGKADKRASVILSGIIPNPKEILTVLDDNGIIVADDDLACCGRRFVTPGGISRDPFEKIAENYFAMPPCSTKDSPTKERLNYIVDKASRSDSKGVIFNLVKFCEPELFDVPFLVDELKKREIATLVIDTEINQGLSGQLKTRIEAFIEMIS